MVARGGLFMLGATFLFALVGVGVKVTSGTMPTEMVVFFRNAGALTALLPFLLLSPDGPSLSTKRFSAHLTRSLTGLASMYCCFYALGRMSLGDAMLLSYTSPLFMVPLAILWVREYPSKGVLPALAMGFLGVGLVLKPGRGVVSVTALVALMSGVFAAVAQVGIRDLTRTEPVGRIVFYFAAVSTAVSAVPLLWAWNTPSGTVWLFLVGTGVLASAAQVFLTRAYRCASPAQVGPFIYSAVVFSGIWDWVLWRRHPDGLSFLGAGFIFFAGAFILRHSARDPQAPLPQE